MLYFDHSTSASDDDKIVALRIGHGGAAVDAYWAVIELMHRDEADFTCPAGLIKTDSVPSGYPVGTQSVPTRYRVAFASLAHRLLIDEKTLAEYVSAMLDVGLLHDATSDSELEIGLMTLRSERASENIADYQKRAETARKNGRRNSRKTQSVPSGYPAGTQSVPSGYPAGTVSKSKSKSKRSVEGDSTHRAQPSALTDTDHDSQIDPPTLEEVRSYFGANSLRGDPDAFFDFYESQGWRKSNGLPIASWTAQAKQWHRGQVERDSERAARGEPTPDEARWRPTVNADPDYDPRAEAERAQEEYERAKARLTPEERRQIQLE